MNLSANFPTTPIPPLANGLQLLVANVKRLGAGSFVFIGFRVLLLDEATSALITVTESDVIESPRVIAGAATVVIAHRLSTVMPLRSDL